MIENTVKVFVCEREKQFVLTEEMVRRLQGKCANGDNTQQGTEKSRFWGDKYCENTDSYAF